MKYQVYLLELQLIVENPEEPVYIKRPSVYDEKIYNMIDIDKYPGNKAGR